jgi:hypothetical protein
MNSHILTAHVSIYSNDYNRISLGDLCRYRNEKLLRIKHHINFLTNMSVAEDFVNVQAHGIACMRESAAKFYAGNQSSPARPLWPNGCTSDNVSKSLSKTECEPKTRIKRRECINLNSFQKVMAFFGGIHRCKDVWVDPICNLVPNEENQKKLLEFLSENGTSFKYTSNDSKVAEAGSSTPILNDRARAAVHRMLAQFDIASNLYILYLVVVMLMPQPFPVFKKALKSRILGLTFGLNKSSFTLLVVIMLTMFDALRSLLKMTDIPDLVAKLRIDPCWVDPEFSMALNAKVTDACAQVARLQEVSGHQTQIMDELYLKIKLFGLCPTDGVQSMHPSLKMFQNFVHNYSNGNLRNPGSCNLSRLQDGMSMLISSGTTSAFDSMIRSGILAQLCLKFVLSSLVLHTIGFFEPLSLHSGLVEIWGDIKLSSPEKLAVYRYLRDGHILPLVVCSLLAFLEFILFIRAYLATLASTDMYLSGVADGNWLYFGDPNSTKQYASSPEICQF